MSEHECVWNRFYHSTCSHFVQWVAGVKIAFGASPPPPNIPKGTRNIKSFGGRDGIISLYAPIIQRSYLIWFLGCLHIGHHAPQVPQVPDARPVPPYEGGPRNIGAVGRQEEAFGWKFRCFAERLVVHHLLLLLFEFSGGHMDASFIVEGEARGRIENVCRLHLRERESG